MYTYTVKKNKTTRHTFRLLGLFLIAFGILQISLFFMGYGRTHVIATMLSFLIACYGIFLFLHSFKKDQYDITYTFNDTNMEVKHWKGVTTYNYADFSDVSLITPEDANLYSIINITVGKENFIIPFSYKKQVCDTIYQYLIEKTTEYQILKEEENN